MIRTLPCTFVAALAFAGSARAALAQELAGRVVDEAGRGLAGATVALADADGTARGSTRSGDDGSFRFDAVPPGCELSAELAGHALVEPVEAFEACELVLHRAGALVLAIVDEQGVGIEQIEFEVEPVVAGLPRLDAWNGRSAYGWTDAHGTVVLEPVWAGVSLAVDVIGDEGEEWRFLRCADGALVPDDRELSHAIRVEPGEREVLMLGLPEPLVLRGRTTTSTGRPYEWQTFAHLVELDATRKRLLPTSELRADVDDDGRFELRLRALPGLGRLGLSLGRSRHRGRDVLSIAVIEPPESSSGALEVELELDDDGAIVGLIDGLPRAEERWSLIAVPAGLAPSQAEELMPRERRAWLAPGGEFEVDDLPAGTYDLVLIEGTGAFGEHVQRFTGLRTGTRAARLAFDPLLPVRIRMRASFDGVDVSNWIALVGRVEGGGEGPAGWSAPAVTLRPRVHLAWPVDIDARAGEYAIVEGEEGIVRYSTLVVEGESLELPATGIGRYVLGAYARGGGRGLAPVVTHALELGAGFHEVSLELRATERLRGRVLGADASRMHFELHDEWGEPLTVRRSIRRFARRFSVRSDGTLYLSEAPVGALRLWVGSEDELDDGRFRVEHRLELREGEPAELVLELGGVTATGLGGGETGDCAPPGARGSSAD